jgi:hypothetical protein
LRFGSKIRDIEKQSGQNFYKFFQKYWIKSCLLSPQNYPCLSRCQETGIELKGGYLGLVKRQQMKPEISAKVVAATPGEVLKPIVTSKGVHLIKLEEIIQPQLDDKLRYQILSELFEAWLKRQVEEVEVVAAMGES